jgi:prepilin-type processing-associated H-X9-DG protein
MSRVLHRRSSLNASLAFARRELVAVVAVLALLGLFILPHLRGSRATVIRTSCTHRLKQVGLAFNLWAANHNGLYPMQYRTNEPDAPAFNDRTNSWRIFQVMSNELQASSVVYCPSDKQRRFATNFTTDFNAGCISFFIGLDANRSRPTAFLSGDRNISAGGAPASSILNLAAGQPAGWSSEMHGGFGNVVLVDGSVSGFNSRQLRLALTATGLATNRFAIP